MEQETLKISRPFDQTESLRELVTTTQIRNAEVLQALDTRLGEITAKMLELGTGSERAGVEQLIVASERAVGEVRQRLESGSFRMSINDLLTGYNDIRERLASAEVPISDIFGSTSTPSVRPVYSVITFGAAVEGGAIRQVSELLNDLTEWFVAYVSEGVSTGRVYVGAYGYGGSDVARLDRDLLVEMSKPRFSRASLERWISEHPIRLDADYPRKSPLYP